MSESKESIPTMDGIRKKTDFALYAIAGVAAMVLLLVVFGGYAIWRSERPDEIRCPQDGECPEGMVKTIHRYDDGCVEVVCKDEANKDTEVYYAHDRQVRGMDSDCIGDELRGYRHDEGCSSADGVAEHLALWTCHCVDQPPDKRPVFSVIMVKTWEPPEGCYCFGGDVRYCAGELWRLGGETWTDAVVDEMEAIDPDAVDWED